MSARRHSLSASYLDLNQKITNIHALILCLPKRILEMVPYSGKRVVHSFLKILMLVLQNIVNCPVEKPYPTATVFELLHQAIGPLDFLQFIAETVI